MGFKILYEDEDLSVIEKPAGVNCDDFEKRVHRLDKDTSGILLVAKNDKALEFLQKQFKERKVKKKYLALVVGNLKKGEGAVDEAIASSPPFANARVIEVKDVELLVKPKIETDIFKTIDAIASKNKKQALELLHKHLEKGDSPLYLLTMINFQFRNLLIIKDLIRKGRPFYTFQKATSLHPYVVKKSYSQTQRFTIEELKKIYLKIFQVDLAVKTGKAEPETALDLLIAEI